MNFIIKWLNRISLKKKLLLIQVFCVIIPLLLTDTIIIGIVVDAQKKEDIRRMKDVADSVTYTLYDYRDQATSLLQDIYMNKKINDFNSIVFISSLDYYSRYYELGKDTLFSVKLKGSRFKTTIYTEARGVINGGGFMTLESSENENWYKAFQDCKDEVMLYTNYGKVNYENKRSVSVIRKLDYFRKNKSNNLVKIDFNYGDVATDLYNSKYASTIYVCLGNDILFSNDGNGGIYEPYYQLNESIIENAGYVAHVGFFDKVLDIYVIQNENITLNAIKNNIWIILFLIGVNIVIPVFVMQIINKSFSDRLKDLTTTLQKNKDEQLLVLPEASGEDEIGILMQSYNDMADRINNLIQNEYKEKLKQQESDIARQRAELLALHSQINPHFLFNALESIRMHSVIKHETETASMVEKLALMQRQNVDWGNDYVTVADEVKFVEAYLELQKYRFGNKLNYEINIDENCQKYRIPKITLVTFVENACVHGMEKKTSGCWIFVRGSIEFDELVLEVEDTGNGISEEARLKLLEEIENVNIKMLQENRSIGILNAALRLKMFTEGKCKFEVESEPGAGTMVIIRIPLENRED